MPKVSPIIFFKMALLSLRRHPIRSGLALLGIVIGIASMTVTMALGEGANERLRQEILAMGEKWIYIIPGNVMNQGELKRTRKKERKLDDRDYRVIKQLPTIQACTPCLETKEIVKYQGKQLVAEIEGLKADYFKIEPRGIKLGFSFSDLHEKEANRVAILGSEVALELFQKENPIGRIILIDHRPFKVLGVFNEAPKKMNRLENPNINIVIPFSSMKNMISSKENEIHHIIVRPKDGKNSTQLVSGLRKLLRFQHQLADEDPDDFTIWDLQAMMQAAHKASQVFNHFLLIAASVSLIVGGIGIMNIMLVAMTERRKEIGIKMAIGATSGQILKQFLIESILLCLTGGITGILFGIASAYFLGTFTDFEWVLEGKILVIAFTTTVFVGVFFGFYPAYKASKLNPIDALI